MTTDTQHKAFALPHEAATCILSQLFRIEALLLDVHHCCFGHSGVFSQMTADNNAAAPASEAQKRSASCFEPGLHEPGLASTPSKRRRLRARRVRERLWKTATGDSSDFTSDEKVVKSKSLGSATAPEVQKTLNRGVVEFIPGNREWAPHPGAPDGEARANEDNFKLLLDFVESANFQNDMFNVLCDNTVPTSTHCARCYSDDACRCADILCRMCWKDLSLCLCAVPMARTCPDCLRLFPMMSDICPSCGEDGAELRTNVIGTEDLCEVCQTYEDQSDIAPCDGAECLGVAGEGQQFMGHRRCMTVVAHPKYEELAALCPSCVAGGMQPYSPSETSCEEA
eukprot:TRINITY_DN35488_c0_g1_i3.p1 TRINITY_DN35488_c0_g1~~TRINITY_DN35488_c0_g1_i3.p1  ORF type:complete len:340 (-),score=37.60 TRINITY_DN35488_c0_g1_i3:198-1217(-)